MTPGGTKEAPLTRTERAFRLVLAAAFLAAGLLKIADPHAFALSIARLRIAPVALIGPVAIVVPWTEVVAAVALYIPRYRRAALGLLLSLLSGFTMILGAALARGAAGSCGCFGSGASLLSRPEVALCRNALLLAIAVFLVLRRERGAPTSPAAPASPA
jgi:putative oxidoreductase